MEQTTDNHVMLKAEIHIQCNKMIISTDTFKQKGLKFRKSDVAYNNASVINVYTVQTPNS